MTEPIVPKDPLGFPGRGTQWPVAGLRPRAGRFRGDLLLLGVSPI